MSGALCVPADSGHQWYAIPMAICCALCSQQTADAIVTAGLGQCVGKYLKHVRPYETAMRARRLRLHGEADVMVARTVNLYEHRDSSQRGL